MPSIYDSYQVAQSQLARPYIGNNLSELRELGNEMQRRYDTTVATMDNIDMLARQASTDPKSDPALKESLQGIRARLQEYSQRPDKENLLRPTSILARDFATDAQTFMGNKAAIVAFNETIDKNDKLDAQTKEKVKSLEYAMYSGLKRDPETGKLVNPFTPRLTPAESIDSAEVVNKIIQGIQSDKKGSVTRGVDGNYYVERGGSREIVTADEVTRIANNIINTDPKIQAYMRFQGQLTGIENSLNLRSLDQITDPTIRKEVEDTMARTGKSAQAVVSELSSAARATGIKKGLIDAAVGKAAFTKEESSYKVMGETEAAGRAATEPLRFMINAPSNVATGELQNMNMSDLEGKIALTDRSIEQSRAQIASLIRTGAAPSDIQAAQNQLRQLQDQRTAAASVGENTRNEAARRLGYQGYQDFVDRAASGRINKGVDDLSTNSKGVVDDMQVYVYDRNGQLVPNTGITKHQLRTALLNNQATESTGSIAGTGIAGSKGDDRTVTIRLANGMTAQIPSGSGTKMRSLLNQKEDAFRDLNREVKTLFKDSKTLEYSTHQINIGEKDGTEILAEMYKSDPNAFTVYDRSGKPITDRDDLPSDLKINSIQVVKNGNGSVMLQGYRETKDKKGNIEDRDYYTIVPNPNNNVGSVIGARLRKDASKMTNASDRADIDRAGVLLQGNDWDGILANSAMNEDVPIYDAFNNRLGFIRRERSQANPSKQVYRIYDKNKQMAQRPGTNGMLTDIATEDLTQAANWVNGIIQTANQRQAAQTQ